MKKTRKETTVVEYEVCDLCEREITTNNGNTVTLPPDEKKGLPARDYYVHMETDGCARQLILDTIAKKQK